MLRTAFCATLCLLPPTATRAAAQTEDHTVRISASVGGKAHEASGPGNCKYFGQDPRFPTWMAHYDDPDEGMLGLDLTYGKAAGSPDRLTLELRVGSASHEINTLIPGKGAGTVTVRPDGKGGRFEIRGKDAGGAPITVTVDCATLSRIEAEGG